MFFTTEYNTVLYHVLVRTVYSVPTCYSTYIATRIALVYTLRLYRTCSGIQNLASVLEVRITYVPTNDLESGHSFTTVLYGLFHWYVCT